MRLCKLPRVLDSEPGARADIGIIPGLGMFGKNANCQLRSSLRALQLDFSGSPALYTVLVKPIHAGPYLGLLSRGEAIRKPAQYISMPGLVAARAVPNVIKNIPEHFKGLGTTELESKETLSRVTGESD